VSVVSLLLSNVPMSPKFINGSFAALFDHVDVVAEYARHISRSRAEDLNGCPIRLSPRRRLDDCTWTTPGGTVSLRHLEGLSLKDTWRDYPSRTPGRTAPQRHLEGLPVDDIWRDCPSKTPGGLPLDNTWRD